MANYWNHILNTALLGTDKQTPDIQQLPEIIQATLAKADKSDKEAYFYTIAALTWQYRRTGILPSKPELMEIKPAVAEEKSYCTNQALIPLKKILSDDNTNLPLLHLWFDKAIAKNWILPPDLLVQILNIGSKLKKEEKSIQEKMREVIGKRGLWLQQFNAAWSFLSELDYEKLWEEGKSAERKDAFIYFRKTNPANARELLQQTWESEGIAAKRDLLWEMKTNLHIEDEPFLKEIYDNLIKTREKKKDTHTDLLKIVVELLFMLPDSELSINTFEKVKSYVNVGTGKKLLGLVSGKPKLELPEKEDDFFNAGSMSQNFGFDKISNKVKSHTDIEYWFEEFVGLLSPQLWKNYLDKEPQEILTIFREAEGFTKKTEDKKKEVHLFSSAFLGAVYRHKAKNFIPSAISQYKSDLPSNLIQIMSFEEAEKFMLEFGVWDAEQKSNLIEKSQSQWSLPLSERFFKEIGKQNNYSYGYDKPLIEKAIPFLDPKVIKAVPDLLREETPEWQKQQWQTQVVIPLTKMLEIRQEIETL